MLQDILNRWGIKDGSSMAFGVDGEIKSSGPDFKVINPSTEQVIFSAKYASDSVHAQLMQAAITKQKLWSQVPAPVRGQLVQHLGQLFREHKYDIATLISHEIGKTLIESLGEVQEMIDMADMAVGQSRMLHGITMPSERAQHRMFEQWHPLGVIAVITAFNFPVAVWAWNAMLAVIAGNVVLWKPSPKAPMTSILIQKMCYLAMEQLGFSGIFYLSLVDNTKVLPLFAEDKRLPLVSFTGSTAIGRKVSALVAQRLGRSLLELSGNNASIACQSADLALLIPSVVFAAVGTTGQRCTSLRRLYVHDSIYEEVIAKLVAAYKQLRILDPWQQDSLLGPLIDAAAMQNFQQTIVAAKALGGRLYTGGIRARETGYFVEPAIIKAEHDWPILQNEAFAPILYVVPFSSLEEAITYQNFSKHGLSSSIFSNNLQEVELFLSVLGSDCGIANVNMGPSGAEIGGAFGGEKDTGGGREAGSDAWKAYMRRQTCTINWGDKLPLAQGIDFGS